MKTTRFISAFVKGSRSKDPYDRVSGVRDPALSFATRKSI